MHSLFNHAWFQAYRSPTTQTKRGPHSALPATEGYGCRGAVSRRAQQKSLPLVVFGTLPLARPSTEFLSAFAFSPLGSDTTQPTSIPPSPRRLHTCLDPAAFLHDCTDSTYQQKGWRGMDISLSSQPLATAMMTIRLIWLVAGFWRGRQRTQK